MSKPATHHTTFVIERSYAAPPARVFAAWAEPKAKAQWFGGPDDWDKSNHELDFRVGGRESVSGGPPGEAVHAYSARYHDIVPNQRIVSSYEMHMDETLSSVSIATVELAPEGGGTRLVYTEQAVYVDGRDGTADRERGTRDLLDKLDAHLRRAVARG